jgi:hypothetical protein
MVRTATGRRAWLAEADCDLDGAARRDGRR